jgi:hypothetical protein
MPNPTVPDFTGVADRKLAELQANGYRITGVCFERQVDGTQPQRGFVDFAGFVGWHQTCRGIPRRGCDYLAACGTVCNKCGRDHAAHGVADMKGGQDGPASPPVL